jgi:hypothetical protein
MPDPIRTIRRATKRLYAMAAGFGMIDPTHFGRKRRARRARGRRIEARQRARGRRIEARQPYSSDVLAWRIAREAEPNSSDVLAWRIAREAEPRRPLAAFIDPSLGVQWGEITGDGSGEALPPIPDA